MSSATLGDYSNREPVESRGQNWPRLDAFAVATAMEFNAILLTGDPEIEPLEADENLKVEWLPKSAQWFR